MVHGVFVTGTDTNVGKTVLSAALVHRYRAEAPLRYWKPIQTGIEQADDTADVVRLAGCRPDEVWPAGIRLERPLSPHLAARLAGVTIDIRALADRMAGDAGHTRWIVEGAGGVLVPINDSELMTDLMTRLGLPVVVAARSTLGTINHTLLTLDALRARSLHPAGVVMIGPPNADNRAAIERYGHIAVLGEMPHFDDLSSERLLSWAKAELDREGRLLEWFA